MFAATFSRWIPILKFLDRVISIFILRIVYFLPMPFVALFINKEAKLPKFLSWWGKYEPPFIKYNFTFIRYHSFVKPVLSPRDRVKDTILDIASYLTLLFKEVKCVISAYFMNLAMLLKSPTPSPDWYNAYYIDLDEEEITVLSSGNTRVSTGLAGVSGYVYYYTKDLFNFISVIHLFSNVCLRINIGYDFKLVDIDEGEPLTITGPQNLVYSVSLEYFNKHIHY